MSFIKITDENGEPLILNIKRISKIKVNEEQSFITLEPVNKDDPEELVPSNSTVEDIWKQIKSRM